MKIYVDMDGVLSDLDGSLAVWGGVSLNFVRSNLDYRESLIRDRVSRMGLSHWESLTPLNQEKWRFDLRALKEAGHEIEILTSYGTWDSLEIGPLSHQGKCNWLKSNYGDLFKEGVLTGFNGVERCTDKSLFSKPGTLLIDDSPKNVSEFSEGFGIAFLYSENRHSEVLRSTFHKLSGG